MISLSNIKISKNLLYALAVVAIFLEVAWGIWTITEPSTESQTSSAPLGASSQKAEGTILSLESAKEKVKPGEQFTVAINLRSPRYTDGADLIIYYDPQLLSVVQSGVSKVPVQTASIYSDYPLNKVDEKNGKVTVSGISSKEGGVIPQGVFGNITFQAKKNGRAKIVFDYTPGSTVDSNVTETKTAQDVLSKVQNLTVDIMSGER